MPKPKRLAVVFDANVLIPLAIPSGKSRSTGLLNRLRAGGHLVAISPELLAEVAEKLRTKRTLRKWLGLSDEEIEEFLRELPKLLGRRLRKPLTIVPVVEADPDDDVIIATAVQARAKYLVTDDPHLLGIGEHRRIKIMNRVDFAAELDRLGVP